MQEFDKFAQDYNETLKEGLGTSDVSYFAEYKIKLIKSLIKNTPEHILEFGCGIGRNLPYIKKYFSNSAVCGFDVSQKSIRVAQKICEDLFLTSKYEELNGNFDLVFISNVYHHIPLEERAEATKKLFELTSDGGEIFVFEQNMFNPLTKRVVDNCPLDENAIMLQPSELKKLLENAGYKNIKEKYCLFVPPALKQLAFIEKYLSWLPLGAQYYVKAQKK